MKRFLFSSILACLMIFFSCTNPVNTGSQATETFKLSLSLADAPTALQSIHGILEREGFDIIERVFIVSSDSLIY